MPQMTTLNLSKLGKHFSDEDAARQLLESLRWPNGAVCPKCGGADPYRLTPKATSAEIEEDSAYSIRVSRSRLAITESEAGSQKACSAQKEACLIDVSSPRFCWE